MSEKLTKLKQQQREIRSKIKAEQRAEKKRREAELSAAKYQLAERLVTFTGATTVEQIARLTEEIFETGRAEVMRDALSETRDTQQLDGGDDVSQDLAADDDAEVSVSAGIGY